MLRGLPLVDVGLLVLASTALMVFASFNTPFD
jgi:hypothetical protein